MFLFIPLYMLFCIDHSVDLGKMNLHVDWQTACYLVSVVGGAIMLVVFETVYEKLQKIF